MSRTMKKAAKAGAHPAAQHHEASEPADHPVERIHAPKRLRRPVTEGRRMPRSYTYRTGPRQG